MNLKVLLGGLRRDLNAILFRTTGFRLINRHESQSVTVTALVNSTLRQKPAVCCIQVGAHDGKTTDPLRELRASPRWRSHLVEPNPAMLPILTRNTREESGTKILPFAMGPQAGQMELWTVCVEKLPAHVRNQLDFSQISSLEREGVIAQIRALIGDRQVPDACIARTTVEVITWERLFAQHVKASPDCVLIDAEGQDAALLRTFPFSRFRPAVVIFEHHWMTKEEFQEISLSLRNEGYALLPIHHDTVAVHVEAWAESYRDYPFKRTVI